MKYLFEDNITLKDVKNEVGLLIYTPLESVLAKPIMFLVVLGALIYITVYHIIPYSTT